MDGRIVPVPNTRKSQNLTMERTHAPHFVSLPSSPQPDRADFRSLL